MISDAATRRVPLIRIRAGVNGPLLNIRELTRHSELLLNLAARDIKVRYKQTVLGVLWVILQPLLAALIFSFVFGLLARMPSFGKPYVLFAFAGLLGWNLFSNAVSRASSAMISNGTLVTKVYFPREVLPFSTVLPVLLDFMVALSMMFVLMAIYGVWPGWGLLLVPLWVAVLLVMAVGIGLLAGAVMVRYRDVQHMIPMFLTLGLYASPVAWSVAVVPERYRLVYVLNPLSGLLEAFRWSLLGEGVLAAGSIIYATAFAVLTFWVGIKVFRHLERRFADVL
jgi:lipopolysaccharide transport system permease protein